MLQRQLRTVKEERKRVQYVLHSFGKLQFGPQKMIIKEKVSFNIASYAYILNGQKFIKKRSKWSILASFCGQTVLPDRSILIRQKLMKKAKIKQFKCYILGDFQTV